MTNLNGSDIHDSEKDREKLKPEEVVIDLPDVEDIPGQANVKPPETNQEEDLTIASDDEEGVGIFEEETDEENIDANDDTNVSRQERELLKDTESLDNVDDEDLKRARLDDRDFEGEKLNERTPQDGKDLDVPGQEADDDNEDIGEEDEENNEYSLGDNQ
ncbi:hypothetical protein ACTJIJ_03130 [Niabella sp. 22666]|uniref:hypothetical protein n=1 Tax=Niabella sp. 22666 TaxID=3453954 RepID=UPI003F831605